MANEKKQLQKEAPTTEIVETISQKIIIEGEKEVSIKPLAPTSSGIRVKPLAVLLDQGKSDQVSNQLEGDGSSQAPFFDKIYDQIHSILGGNNPNQFLCLTIPGQALSAEDFAYNLKDNVPKGPTVEANESRLANKLFDPCCVTGADNGMTLPYQYRSALDTLSPKLNAKVAQAKNQLRELLLTPYPYNFGEKDNNTYTLQEVFYRLYDDYMKVKQKWSEMQNDKNNQLNITYEGRSTATDHAKRNDEYLLWYETVAQSEIANLNEKRAKVLSVFSPNDMDIIDGILDSGSGAELQHARETLMNTKKLTPDGGYIYPVKFYPPNWFEYLDTSFTAIDLLKTPEALSMQLNALTSQKHAINAKILEYSALVPKDGEVDNAKKQVEKAREALNIGLANLTNAYGNGIKSIFSALVDLRSVYINSLVPGSIIIKLASGFEKDPDKLKKLVGDLTSVLESQYKAQDDLLTASAALANALKNSTEVKNNQILSDLLNTLNPKLVEINNEIENLKTQINISSAFYTQEKELDANGKAPLEELTPPEVPPGFTKILMQEKTDSLDKTTAKASSASVSTVGASFWFGGYSSKSETSSASFSDLQQTSKTDIQIGMNIAKVGIEREWFNPGVFVLSKDMFNVATTKISPDIDPKTTNLKDKLDAMRKGFIFPCYPVAMIIARDISIRITSSDSLSSTFTETVESHAAHGGGFLFFRGSSSSDSSSSTSDVHTFTDDKSITIKFSTPQIIGYYLQITPADKSTPLDDNSQDQIKAGYVTITKFVEDYKKMLLEMKKKQETPQPKIS